jgi:oligogalacturonide lyase
MKTGRTQPLTEEPVGAFVLDSRRGRLYYTSGNDFRHIAIAPVFRGKAAPRRFAALPPGVLRMEGGISLDAKGDVLYAGAAVEENKQWALFALEIASASWKEVTELDFKVGHIQANPVLTRVLMFCHETGGDAPQRTWTVNADGTGLRPFYKETYNEWVTHGAGRGRCSRSGRTTRNTRRSRTA